MTSPVNRPERVLARDSMGKCGTHGQTDIIIAEVNGREVKICPKCREKGRYESRKD